MLRLAFILFLFIGTTLAGSLMVAALASGYDTLYPVIVAAVIGAIIGVPVSWLVARKLYSLR